VIVIVLFNLQVFASAEFLKSGRDGDWKLSGT